MSKERGSIARNLKFALGLSAAIVTGGGAAAVGVDVMVSNNSPTRVEQSARNQSADIDKRLSDSFLESSTQAKLQKKSDKFSRIASIEALVRYDNQEYGGILAFMGSLIASGGVIYTSVYGKKS